MSPEVTADEEAARDRYIQYRDTLKSPDISSSNFSGSQREAESSTSETSPDWFLVRVAIYGRSPWLRWLQLGRDHLGGIRMQMDHRLIRGC